MNLFTIWVWGSGRIWGGGGESCTANPASLRVGSCVWSSRSARGKGLAVRRRSRCFGFRYMPKWFDKLSLLVFHGRHKIHGRNQAGVSCVRGERFGGTL